MALTAKQERFVAEYLVEDSHKAVFVRELGGPRGAGNTSLGPNHNDDWSIAMADPKMAIAADFVNNKAFATENCVNISRFWSKVEVASPGDCWEWTGALNGGYGQFHVGLHRDSVMLAHRVAYGLHTGDLPEVVCHQCDNPKCCNPAHLFGGTRADNNRDKSRKGRASAPRPNHSGERHNQAKLSNAQVSDIRCAYAAGGATQRALARKYGVSQRTINKAVRGISFRNVPSSG